ncbi:unnamed protein product [Ambrosiozyma monospora]|uniref:Unnamed protein product n=1 Tax=Ambrosiozyma monospora TaxID=43982 RepID=A0ACB5UC86_AMBMO|nr:unnamed protein product [Ambrosiozyma monospora]
MSHNDFCVRNQFTNLTVLLPLDSALSFNDIEMDYLYTDLGEDDRLKLVSNYLISGMIGGNLNESVSVQNKNGGYFNISSELSGGKLLINNVSKSIDANMLLSDGVAHTFHDVLVDTDQYWPTFTPRKYLYGLNQTSFVEELDFRKLSKLIDDNEVKQTIFVVYDADTIFSTYGQIKNGLLYHFATARRSS